MLMISHWLNTLRELGILIREIYLVPGEFVLSRFTELAPVTAGNWGIGGDATTVAAVTSGIFWLFMSIAPESVHIVRLPFARGWVAAAHGDETIVAPNEDRADETVE